MHTTPVSLLNKLRETDNARAWERFVELYTPCLYYWARRVGLHGEEATDLVQDVFAVLLTKLHEFQYDRTRSFRAWLADSFDSHPNRSGVTRRSHSSSGIRSQESGIRSQGSGVSAAHSPDCADSMRG